MKKKKNPNLNLIKSLIEGTEEHVKWHHREWNQKNPNLWKSSVDQPTWFLE